MKLIRPYMEDKNAKDVPIDINNLLKLKDILKLMTRNQLVDMSRVLKVWRISNLKKEVLRETLESYIKTNIHSILTRLTKDEYDLLQKLLKNHGEIDYEDNLLNSTLYLNKLGMVFIKRNRGHSIKIFMPLDIYEQSYYYTFNSLIFKRIKFNEKVNKVLTYILYYYRVMDTEDLYSIFKLLFDEQVDKIDFMDILNENKFKIKDLNFYDGYWHHNEVMGSPKVAAMQNMGDKRYILNEVLAFENNNLL